ncbi:hypothetical protein FRC03_004636 [Tulasnella sp. 419]|nr:hypothetical protein FRC03_004636 [Tulasnella sp. 419]
MVSEGKGNHVTGLEGGTYLIRSLQSNTNVNMMVEQPGKEPFICIWKTTRSPTELWNLEPTEKGYRIRNLSTNRYISHRRGENMKNGVLMLGTDYAAEWQIEEIEDSPLDSQDSMPVYRITLQSNPNLSLDLGGHRTRDGSVLCVWEWHGKLNQRWGLERVMDEKPPSYHGQAYIGAVPAGIYWLGQPQLEEERSLRRSRTAPSTAALSVAATRPLMPDIAAPAYLYPIGVDGPFSNQIWEIEAGMHGYRLKNIATKSYLNCVNRVLVAEPLIHGPAGATEWIFRKDPTLSRNDILDFWIHPSIDHALIMGVGINGIVHQARVKSLDEYQNELQINFTQWRLEAVEESSLADL